jgi:signal recognition particle subunit SRP68
LGNRKNALVLFDRAFNLAGQSQSLISQPPQTPQPSPPGLDIQPAELTSLRQLLQAEVFRFRALVEIDNLEESSKKLGQDAKAGVPLIERLSEYPAEGVVALDNLVTYPPVLEPVPVKPLFLDLAWNYIDYPGRSTQAAEKPEAAAPKAGGDDSTKASGKKGWFGFGR